jgi:hypothetical protein
LETLAMTNAFYREQKMPTCISAQLLADFCYFQLQEWGKIELVKKGAAPGSASDYYFLGFACLWIRNSNDKISDLLRTYSPLAGMDLKQPAADPVWLLRQAVMRAPQHYWSCYWLGKALSITDLRGGELVFNQCVLLRPEQAWGYAERALVLAAQSSGAPEPLKTELANRARRDFETALKLEPNNFSIRLSCFWTSTWLADWETTKTQAKHFLELTEPPRTSFSTRVEDYKPIFERIRTYLQRMQAAQPNDSEISSLIAHTHLLLGQNADAEKLADAILQEKTNLPNSAGARSRAFTVRGIVRLQANQAGEALSDFQQARNLDSDNRLALWGKLKALESLERWNELARASDDLRKQVVTDWQRIEAYRFRGRAAFGLQRPEETRQALAQIREMNAKLAQRLEEEWFKPK